MPINSRAKGVAGELEFAKALRKHGFKARRGQQHRGGADSPDVITDMPGIQWEVKRVELLNINKAMAKAIADTDFMDMPAVAHRKNGTEWLVTVRLDDFMRLYNGEFNVR